MRFHVSAAMAALCGVAAAQNDGANQYKAQFQGFMDKMASYIPNPGTFDPVAAAEAKVGSMQLNVLTLENWKSTLYGAVPADAIQPTEFWVFMTGGNKTCLGRCGQTEQAFNETAGKFALTSGSPHMGLLNCDHQPILCNSWSVNPNNLYIFEMRPRPSPINIITKRLNSTSTTSEELVSYMQPENRKDFTLLDSWFHPFDGKAAELGLAVPFAYTVWAFSLVPQWVFMILVSFASRSFVSGRFGPSPNPPPRPGAAPAGAARPARPAGK